MSYVSEVLADGARGFWRCQEASGNIQDSSGNANHATAVAGAGAHTYSQAGPILSDATSKSIKFVNKSFRIPDHATLDVGDVFTCEAWVKRAVTGGGIAYPIMSKGWDGGAVGGFYFKIDVDTPALTESNVAEIGAATTSITETTTWHHLAVTKNGATVKFYTDGVDVTGSITNSTVDSTAHTLDIGEDTNAEWANQWMTELAVYPTALTQARLQAHIDAALTTGQTLLPDADLAAGGWTTSPLFSKVNDSSDATIITATAS